MHFDRNRAVQWLEITLVAVVAFILGYFCPRDHYELRHKAGDSYRVCAVNWEGMAGCSSPLEGWIPGMPR